MHEFHQQVEQLLFTCKYLKQLKSTAGSLRRFHPFKKPSLFPVER
jgi:hypothetical protein